jgi:hypothetical protein
MAERSALDNITNGIVAAAIPTLNKAGKLERFTTIPMLATS